MTIIKHFRYIKWMFTCKLYKKRNIWYRNTESENNNIQLNSCQGFLGHDIV